MISSVSTLTVLISRICMYMMYVTRSRRANNYVNCDFHYLFSFDLCRNQAEKTDSQMAAVRTAEKLLKVSFVTHSLPFFYFDDSLTGYIPLIIQGLIQFNLVKINSSL